jgi:hypothetical protein
MHLGPRLNFSRPGPKGSVPEQKERDEAVHLQETLNLASSAKSGRIKAETAAFKESSDARIADAQTFERFAPDCCKL